MSTENLTEEEKKKQHAEYMKEYTRKNKERINARRRERRKERVAAGEEELLKEQSRERNRRYHDKNRDEVNARAKERNWNYDKEARVEIRARHYDKYPVRNLLRQRRQSAEKKGLPFEITEEWYEEQFNLGCAMTGKPFDEHRSDSPWVAHIDRIVPELGYTKENCRLVCGCYNLAKKHWKDEDVLEMAQMLVENTSK